MKNRFVMLIIIVAILVAAIKFVEPVNDWARGSLPEGILELIGEEPKGLFGRGSDLIEDSLNKGSDVVDDLVDKIGN